MVFNIFRHSSLKFNIPITGVRNIFVNLIVYCNIIYILIKQLLLNWDSPAKKDTKKYKKEMHLNVKTLFAFRQKNTLKKCSSHSEWIFLLYI